MIDCSKLKGRMFEICSGYDKTGNSIDVAAAKRMQYMKILFPNISDEEIVQFIAGEKDNLNLNNKSKVVLGKTFVAPKKCTSCGASKKIEAVGTYLKNRIKNIINIEPTAGCKCKNLANEMDINGIDWCVENKEKIINQLVNSRSILIDALKNNNDGTILEKISGKTLEIMPDFILIPILKFGAEYLLNLAIEDAKKNVEKNKTPIILKKNQKIVLPLTSIQKKLHRDSLSKRPLISDPFTSTPIIHFGAHLWPVKTFWKKHVDKWNELAEKINGKCFVGVATDSLTDSFEYVKSQFSNRFELFELENTPQGENPTFREFIKLVPSGNDDVLIYCHGKGVRSHTNACQSIKIWTEHMYETVVFNYEKAIEKFKEGYKCFGSYRTFGDIPLSPKYRWHYSGTFFIVRAKYLKNTIVKSGYGGVECWPGDNFDVGHSYCEFLDGQPFKLGYDLESIYPTVVDLQMDWEVQRLGGPRCEQHKRELEWFYKYIKQNDKILIIGSKHGGLEYQINKNFQDVKLVSCDISPQQDNKSFIIVGDSSNIETQEKIKNHGPYDIIFIDGDHSYRGVKKDFEFAISLNPKLIAFHDIAKAIKHDREGCEVDVLWNEIKKDYITEEKIVGCGWGGIGVIILNQE